MVHRKMLQRLTTRSKDVNSLVKAVDKKETQGHGAKPKTSRPLDQEEFKQAITMLEANDDIDRCL